MSFTVEEASRYLPSTIQERDAALNELLDRWIQPPEHRCPVVLKAASDVLNRAFNPTALERQLDQMVTVSLDRQIEAVFVEADVPPKLRFELRAPPYLDSTVVSTIAAEAVSRVIRHAQAGRLLEKLYAAGLLKRFSGRYWWEGAYAKALRSTASPSVKTFRRLFEQKCLEVRARINATVDALHFLEGARFSLAKKRAEATKLLKNLHEELPAGKTIPSYPILEHHFADPVISEAAAVRRLHAHYLECRGEYDTALKIVGELPPDNINLRILDKQGRFNELREVISACVTADGLEPKPNRDWSGPLAYYYGRLEQATGNMAYALQAYEIVIDGIYDSGEIYRIHALVESATIYVFAEEPDQALAMLDTATKLAFDEAFERERADIFRYRARAEKLAAIVGDAFPERVSLDRAEEHAVRALETARQLNYSEVIWARVLTVYSDRLR
jgi:tetratricopeptide (TPR) repeat protein